MNKSSKVEAYWQEYLASLPQESLLPRSYEIWHFGDTEKMADELGDLVRVGVKTATSALVWELESNGEKVPKVGDIAVVSNLVGESNVSYRNRTRCFQSASGASRKRGS